MRLLGVTFIIIFIKLRDSIKYMYTPKNYKKLRSLTTFIPTRSMDSLPDIIFWQVLPKGQGHHLRVQCQGHGFKRNQN